MASRHTHSITDHHIALDENGLLGLAAHLAQDNTLQCAIIADVPVGEALIQNLSRIATLHAGGHTIPFTADGTASMHPLPEEGVFLAFGGQTVAHLTQTGSVLAIAWQAPRRLSVFETRMLGRSHQTGYVPDTFDEVHFTPLTDLHTHLSGQVTAKDLIALGIAHDMYYPTRALAMAGIECSGYATQPIPKRLFLPLAHLDDGSIAEEEALRLGDLPPQELKKLEYAFSLPIDRQNSFQAIEQCYWLREPFTKDLSLLPEILERIAQDYARQGVRYAELSSNAALDPDWLTAIHACMPTIEQNTGVQLRFLAGLPRNLESKALEQRIEQIKRVAASPYVVGVDVLGFEMNKTSYMNEHFETLGQWMQDERPDLVLRVHAGENSKNPTNVREVLDLARRYRIRVRIGHAIHGLESDVIALARALPESVMVEFNPDSNMAGNNIDFPSEVPMHACLESHTPYVLGSDGASLYLTDARQTAIAAMLCGVQPEHARAIRQTEETYIARQQQMFKECQQRQPSGFLASLPRMKKSMAKKISMETVADDGRRQIDELLTRKHPILIAGAGGSSFSELNADARAAIEAGFTQLLQMLDPQKVCFLTGRTKAQSIGSLLAATMMAHRYAQGVMFDLVQVLAEREHKPHSPEGLLHTMRLDVPLVFLPGALIPLVKGAGGMGLFIGGRQFTRDFITEAKANDLPCGIMSDAAGASAHKAMLYPNDGFDGATGMVAVVQHHLPKTFK